MHRFGILVAPQIVFYRLRGVVWRRNRHPAGIAWPAAGEKPAWISSDDALRYVERLGEEEPVPVAQPELHVGAAEMLAGGQDVEHRQVADAVGVVEGEPVRTPSTPVVARHREALEAEL